jgi:hypothetical protein
MNGSLIATDGHGFDSRQLHQFFVPKTKAWIFGKSDHLGTRWQVRFLVASETSLKIGWMGVVVGACIR